MSFEYVSEMWWNHFSSSWSGPENYRKDRWGEYSKPPFTFNTKNAHPCILPQVSLVVWSCSGNSLITYKIRPPVCPCRWLSTLARLFLGSGIWWTELKLHLGILKPNLSVWQNDCSLRQFIWFLFLQYSSGSAWVTARHCCMSSIKSQSENSFA